MTTVYECRRWEISLGQYVIHKGTAEYIKAIGGEIVPGTAEKVDPTLLNGQGRYKTIAAAGRA